MQILLWFILRELFILFHFYMTLEKEKNKPFAYLRLDVYIHIKVSKDDQLLKIDARGMIFPFQCVP